MKISFVIWDGNFREYFHTLKCFENQISTIDFEVIWCDFYENTNEELKKYVARNDNFKLINLKNDDSKSWNEGVCINHAVSKAQGDVIALIDGDIFFDLDFVETVASYKLDEVNKAVYLRRYDENEQDHDKSLSYTITHLDKVAKLNNPFNYAAFLGMSRSLFNKLAGYETHSIFDGPGGASIDMRSRLLNTGAFVSSQDYKIYHPWHPFTGRTNKYQESSILFSKHYKWINGYIGVKQSWIIKRRQENLSYAASKEEVDRLLTELHPRLTKPLKYLRIRLFLNRLLRRFGI
ncbi:MAG: glycosyltransferase [Bacteroidia bacterium]|nr:glycosyltransferase [Bacteroidia bacterium]NNJ56818.1 glycosyltransferase [Bacteroidia bacterium]